MPPETEKEKINNEDQEFNDDVEAEMVKRRVSNALMQGENRKVNVLLRKPYTLNSYGFVENLSYRIYVKQGKNLVEICDWQQIGKSYDNHFFYIDTSWMIPQTYYVDIKVEAGGEVNLYSEELKFTVNSKVII